MSLLASYNFDEGSGTTTADKSGNGKTATATGTPWRASGHTLAGAGNTVAVAAGFTVPILGSTINTWTIEFWMKTDSGLLPGALQAILADASQYYFYVDPTNGLTYPGNSAMVVGAINAAWHHVAASCNGTTITAYLDGVSVGTAGVQNFLGGSVKNFGNDLPMTTAGAFIGTLDDLRIYSNALTAPQIVTDMNTPVGSGTPPSSLVGASLSDYERDYYARRGISTQQSLEDMRLAFQGQPEYFYWQSLSGLGPGYSLSDHKRKAMMLSLSLSDPASSNADLALAYWAK